jgi:hypothetical protein
MRGLIETRGCRVFTDVDVTPVDRVWRCIRGLRPLHRANRITVKDGRQKLYFEAIIRQAIKIGAHRL